MNRAWPGYSTSDTSDGKVWFMFEREAYGVCKRGLLLATYYLMDRIDLSEKRRELKIHTGIDSWNWYCFDDLLCWGSLELGSADDGIVRCSRFSTNQASWNVRRVRDERNLKDDQTDLFWSFCESLSLSESQRESCKAPVHIAPSMSPLAFSCLASPRTALTPPSRRGPFRYPSWARSG